jgi:hypothetical protein
LTTNAQIRAQPADRVMAAPERRAAAASIMERLIALRRRCQRQTSSMFTPMGNEMFYRYQQSLIDDATTTVAALLQGAPGAPVSQSRGPASLTAAPRRDRGREGRGPVKTVKP